MRDGEEQNLRLIDDETCLSQDSTEVSQHLPNLKESGSIIKRETLNTTRLVLFLSLCTNVLLVIGLYFFGVARPSLPPDTVSIRTSSGITYNQVTTYHHHSAYWGTNDSLADALWEQLSTDPIVVAVPDTWAEQHHLPRSARWPWDPNRGRYFIRAFHELHCLKYIRRYVLEFQRGEETLLVGSHVLHCIDSLRQSVMCRADDTLMPTSDDTKFAIGDLEETQCRDWDELTRWALAPERHACHKSLDDYMVIRHPIERYAFCPEWSPYKDIAEKYFDKHGHQDPWGEAKERTRV